MQHFYSAIVDVVDQSRVPARLPCRVDWRFQCWKRFVPQRLAKFVPESLPCVRIFRG
ncbi:hypothetical protein [Xanthomonas cannabis]|uniref:hypothetical protein n=1 Tax=Xanthomonas cannabis TaxID=1885674 RepID=UPI00141BDEE9|nr:hypothetical protein [Xanthomonas cannabis]